MLVRQAILRFWPLLGLMVFLGLVAAFSLAFRPHASGIWTTAPLLGDSLFFQLALNEERSGVVHGLLTEGPVGVRRAIEVRGLRLGDRVFIRFDDEDGTALNAVIQDNRTMYTHVGGLPGPVLYRRGCFLCTFD